jgi:hypothetical protein
LKDICIIQEDNGLPPVVIAGDIDGWETKFYFKFPNRNEWIREKFLDKCIILDEQEIEFVYRIRTFKNLLKHGDVFNLRICLSNDRNLIDENGKLIFTTVREYELRIIKIERSIGYNLPDTWLWSEVVKANILNYRDLINEDL